MSYFRKFLTIAVMFTATVIVSSCKEEPIDPPEPPVVTDPTITTDAPEVITFNADGSGGVNVINVETNQPSWDWNLDPADGNDWLIVVKDENTLSLSVPENEEGPREDVLLNITAGEAEPVTITVKQTEYIVTVTGLVTTFETEGLTGSLTVKYTDGSSTTAEIENGIAEALADENFDGTVYSISSDAIGEVFIGRKAGETISLKFENDELVFRAPVEERIPIGSYSEFALMGLSEEALAGHYFQEADLDLLGSEGLATVGLERCNWLPVGRLEYEGINTFTLDTPFLGQFDGRGFSISNLWIEEKTTLAKLGLFGYLGYSGENSIEAAATVNNVHIVSGSVSGIDTIGAVCGENLGIIIGCSNAAAVTGRKAGGIAGNNSGMVHSCDNSGAVTGYNGSGAHVGGIAGDNGNDIIACRNTGKVTGVQVNISNVVGGIVGDNIYMGTIVSCYNEGDVLVDNTNYNWAGGISGTNLFVVMSCYNIGTVSSTGGLTSTGGVLGDNGNIIIECFWLKRGDESPVGIDRNGQGKNAHAFGEEAWPGIGQAYNDGVGIGTEVTWPEAGWGTGNGTGENYWRTLGSWSGGGTPDGVNSGFPKLYWE